jgi:hypothetical protein
MHPTSKDEAFRTILNVVVSVDWIFKAISKNGELQDGEYWQCPNQGIALTKEYLQATHLQQSKTY